MSDSSTTKRFFILLSAILVLAVGGFFVWRWAYSPPTNEFNENLAQARSSFYDREDNAAVSRLEDIVKNAPSNKEKAQAEVSLADAYFWLNDDLDKSVNLYKEIAGNEAYPAEPRATALRAMLNIFDGSPASVDTFAKRIFTGSSAWESLQGADGRESVRNMCAWSNELYETARAHICMADWYAGEVLGGKLGLKNIDSSQSKEYEETALQHLDRADIMIGKEALYPSLNKISINYMKEAVVYGMLYAATGDSAYKKKAENSFQLADDTASSITEAYIKNITVSSIKYYRLVYLALLTTSGIEDHTAEIQSIGQTYKDNEEATKKAFANRFQNRDRHTTHTVQEVLHINVGRILTRYGDFLKENGWVF